MRKLYALQGSRKSFVLFFVFVFALVSHLKAQVDIQIGTGTTTNDNTGYPCPLQDYYEGSRMQYLYLASELQAAGMGAGYINSIKYDVLALATSTNIHFAIERFTIKIGGTSVGSLDLSAWETGLTPVYGPFDYTPVLGSNEFVFTTPFFWNGTDNIIIEICDGDPDNPNDTYYTGNANVPMTTGLGFNANHTYRLDNNGNLCSASATTQSGTETSRPNIYFNWLPNTSCSGTPAAGTAQSNKSNVCANEPFTLSLSGATAASGLTYQWQISTDNTNWSDITGATAASFTTSQITSSYYRRSTTCTAGGTTVYSTSVQVTNPALVSGVFTINSGQQTGGTNFNTFGEALSSLSCGINGPVVFNVAPFSGPYSEQLVIPQIPGASATNTITFNGNGATLLFNSTNSSSRAGILLNGADHIIIDSLIIDGSGGTYAWGIVLMNQADSNIIRKCNINIGNLGSSSTSYMGIVLNGSATSTVTTGNNANGNLFDRNTVNGGYYGIHVYGNSTASPNVNNVFTNNTVLNNYGYGFYVGYQANIVISNNDISRPSRSNTTTMYAIYMTTGVTNALVERNRIHNMFDALSSSTSSLYCIYDASNAVAGQEVKVINNLIYNTGGNGSVYGIYNTDADYMQAYHNTVALDDQSATSGSAYGIYQTTTAVGLVYRDNIVDVSRSGTGTKRCIYFGSTSSSIISNNNVLYMNSSAGSSNYLGQFGSTNYSTLANWQTANNSAYDQQSLSADPLFINPGAGDYTPSSAAINDRGVDVGVTTDINGIARGVNPDPGAFEFSLPPCTSPPTAGTAVASTSTICAFAPFTLDLTGNSVGSNQTYQWQSSPNNAAPWTNVSTAGSISALTISQTTSLYYRAGVTCGAGATVYSTSVQVNANPAFPAGTYTINKNQPTGGPNFQSFADAVSAMTSCGIAGPVVFNVVTGSGPYNEQVTIPQIANTSAVNTVTFNGNGESIVYNSTTSANRAGILLNGADHIIIDSLNINGSAGTYAWGITLTNQADSNTIRRCTVNIGNLTSTSTNYIGIIINGSVNSTATEGNNGNGNVFDRNTVNGGYYGYYIYGSSSANNKNNTITNSTIHDVYAYSTYMVYQSNGVISNNNISRPARTTSTSGAAGVYLSSNTVNSLVERNRIHNMFDAMPSNTSTLYGIYTSGTGVSGQENRIINNAIYNPGGNGTVYGIYNSTSPYMQAYHNTIAINDATATSGSAYGFYQTGTASNIVFRNNIVVVTRSGTGTKRALYFSSTGSSITSNNNVLYLNATAGTDNHLGQYGTTNFTTFANWKTANSNAYDQQSVNEDPVFTNPSTGDFTPTSLAVNAVGAALGVTTDINGDPRDATTPDPGAFEFVVGVGVNMRADALIAPAATVNNCYSSAETVTVRVRNNGISTIDFSAHPVTVTVKVTGAATQTLSAIINSGTLASNTTMNVDMAAPLDMTAPGIYTFKGYTSVTGDINADDDSMPVSTRTKVALDAGTVSASPGSFCVTPGTPTLSTTGAAGYSGLQWQQSTTAGTGFTDILSATSSPYTPGSPITQAMYYRLVATCGAVNVTSAEIPVLINNPLVTDSLDVERCGPGAIALNASANTGATINWYAAATGGVPIATGNTFTTPSLNTTTTYYVAASQGGGAANAGRATPQATSTGFNGDDYGLIFDATQAFTLVSVNVYPTSTTTGSITVQLENSAGTVIQTAGPFTIPAGTGTTYGTGATPVTLALNFPITPGTNYRLQSSSHSGNLIRDNPISGFSYPMPISSVGTMTGGLLGGGSSTATYYFFYDWLVTTGCESPRASIVAAVNETTNVITHPANDSACLGGNASFHVAATGAGLSYQWRKDGVNIPGAISSTYNVTGAASGDAGNYDVIVNGACGADTSNTASLQIRTVTTINTQPASKTACVGDNVTFSVDAAGAGTMVYQWRKGGTNIPGANSSDYTITGITAASAGDYDVIITGGCGVLTSSSATLTVNAVTTIGTQPTAQTVCTGGTVTFTVAATGTGTLAYQWRKGGNDIAGATSDTYTINPVTTADAGNYDVVISGICSPVSSNAVALTVTPATSITTQPTATTACEGGPASLSVVAAGGGLTYQWKKGTTDINGATSATYTIPVVSAADAGSYSVVVTGNCGSATSSSVTLTVNPAGTWTGITSDDWSNPSNWCGNLPSATTDAVIPSTAPNMPVIHNGTVAARNITIGNGGSLLLGANATLEIYGNVTNSGSFNATAGNLSFRGNNSQSMPAFTAANVTMNGNGGMALGGNAAITGTLTLTNGHITLGANNLALSAGSTGSLASHIITNGAGQVSVINLAPSSTRVIPVGINAGSYNPVTLAANSNHTADNFTVSVRQGVLTNGVSGNTFTDWVVDRTWTINEANAGGSNVNVTLQWAADQELNRFERFRSYVAQYAGTAWTIGPATNANGADPYTQTRNNVTSFSVFAVQRQPIPDAPTGIFPNPVTATLNVVVRPIADEQMTLQVYDASGKLMMTKKESVLRSANLLQIDVSTLIPGLYILKVSSSKDKEFLVRKFLKVD